MERQDDRTEDERATHTWGIVGTDRFLSWWGHAKNGTSIAVWACEPKHRRLVEAWVRSRSDMQRVREVSNLADYRPRGAGHVHIYVVHDDHPALHRINASAPT